MMETLKDRVALVTGGARGLGEAICYALGEAGARVVVADMRHELAQEVVAKVQADGCEALALQVDVSERGQVEQAIRGTVERFGRLDILVNNAGTDVTLPLEEISIDDWERVVRVNLFGPFLASKFALPVMRQQGRGHIVNVASTAAKRTWANASAYHASKWGLVGFSHALLVEARPHNVKVTTVIAGGMRTPFLLDRFPDIDVETLQDPRNVAEAIRFILTQPDGTVVPEVMVLPMRETSWP